MKIQSIFKMQTPKKDLKNPLTSFVPGVNANLQYAPCIQVLKKSFLELVRMKKIWTFPDEDTAAYLLPDIDILKTYEQHLETCELVVELPFRLQHISDSEIYFENLYGIVLLPKSSPPCKKISDNCFLIDIVPSESHPVDIFFRVEFTCSNGQNYICHPDSIHLNFKDFFLTLSAPQSLKEHVSLWKKKLFEILWEEFQKNALAGSEKMKCCKSAICLKKSKEEFNVIIKEHWKQFIVATFDEFKHWIAIVLRPKNHLLMKIDIINEKPFINIVVDDISILPWTALYLQEITKC